MRPSLPPPLVPPYNRPMAEAVAEYRRLNLSSDPIHRYVRVTKPGGVPGAVAEQDLVDDGWCQRLRRIHQMQSAWWVFATAEHSRFQHSLGAMHLAGEWGRHLYPTLRQQHPDVPSQALVVETLRLAGLLHDVGHEVVGRHLILGELAPLVSELGASPDADFAPGERIDPRWVAYLSSPEP